MADYLPLFRPGQTLPLKASAAITGGQLLEVSGENTVAPAGASSLKVVGVAGQDTANGDVVTVHRGGVQRLVASGAVSAGDLVRAAAAGKVADADDGEGGHTAPIGIALTDATDGDIVDVVLN